MSNSATESCYATKALEWINERIAEKKTVYISTATKVMPVSPKTIKTWEKSGNTLFKVTENGLVMASGKNFFLIASPTGALCKISAK